METISGRSFEELPAIGSQIVKALSDTQKLFVEYVALLQQYKDFDQVLEGVANDEMLTFYENQLGIIKKYEQRLLGWKRVERVLGSAKDVPVVKEWLLLLKQYTELTIEIISALKTNTVKSVLSDETRNHKIEQMMAKTKIKPTVPGWRFLLVTDQAIRDEGKYLTFFFRQNGSNQEIRTFLKGLFEDIEGRFGDVQGFGSKRISIFLKTYSEEKGMDYIQGIIDFTQESLLSNVAEMGTTSYMQLACDEYDKNGYPVMSEVKLNS